MGIFDFLFGRNKNVDKEKKSPPIVSKNNPRQNKNNSTLRNIKNRLSTPRVNSEWKNILEEAIALDRTSERPIYQLRYDNDMFSSLKRNILLGYEIAQNNMNPEELRPFYKSGSGNFFHAFTTLESLNTKFQLDKHEYYNSTQKGLIIAAMNEAFSFQNYIVSNRVLSILRHLMQHSKDAYLPSLCIEQIHGKDFNRKLYSLMTVYQTSNGSVFDKIEPELEDLISKSKQPQEIISPLLHSENALMLYVQTRRQQENLDRTTPSFHKEKLRIFTEMVNNSIEHLTDIYSLFMYEFRDQYKANDLIKGMSEHLLSKLTIDYSVIHKMLDITNSCQGYCSIFGTSFLLKHLKVYFKHEPLDQSTYNKLIYSMQKADTLARKSSINEFLYSKKDHLYNIKDQDFYKYQHSGILSLNYYQTNSIKNKYVENLVALINQAIPSFIQSQQENDTTLTIGNASHTLRIPNNYKINEILYQQNIPYQLTDVVVYIDKNAKLKTTLLLSEDEFHQYSHAIQLRSQRQNSDSSIGIKFAPSKDEVFSVNNHIKSLRKKHKSEMGENAFLHDIKWKEIKTRVIDNFKDRRSWYDIMHIIVSHPNSVQPSTTWKKKLKETQSKVSDEDFIIDHAKLIGSVLNDDLWMAKINLRALRGIIASCLLLPEERALQSLEVILKKCYVKIPGVGPQSISGASSCMSTMVDIDTKESYNLLIKLRDNTNYDRFKKHLTEWLEKFEKNSASTVSSLKEASTEDLGFINGSKILEIQFPHFVKWTVKNRKAKSQWIDEKGVRLSKAPQLAIDTKRTLSTTTKRINEAIDLFDERMLSFQISDVSWDIEDWKKNYLDHGFISLLIDNYLWIVHHTDGSKSSIITREGKIYDFLNNEVILNDNSKISIFHQILTDRGVIERWKSYFIKYKLTLPFDYFNDQHFDESDFKDILKMYSNSEHYNFYLAGNGWQRVEYPSQEMTTYALEFPLIDKLVAVSRLTPTRDRLYTPITVEFYKLPKRKRKKYSYSIQELGDKINSDDLQTHIRLKIYHLIEQNMFNSISRNLTPDLINDSKGMFPRVRYYQNFYKHLLGHMKNETISIDNYQIKLKGKIHQYVIPIYGQFVQIDTKTKPAHYHLHSAGKPKENWPQILNIALKLDKHLSDQMWAIEQLLDESKAKNKPLIKWIENIAD